MRAIQRLLLVGLTAASPVSIAARAAEPPPGGADCGTMALGLMLRLQGVAAPEVGIARSLPPPRPAGYSMKELRDAAHQLGVRLSGVRLGRDRPPAGPSLVFLRRGSDGHFIVIRPVGHTGRLVQVIDPNEDPRVIDASRLRSLPGWTGLALVPAPPVFSNVSLAILVSGVVALVLVRRLTQPSGTRQPAPRPTARVVIPPPGG